NTQLWRLQVDAVTRCAFPSRPMHLLAQLQEVGPDSITEPSPLLTNSADRSQPAAPGQAYGPGTTYLCQDTHAVRCHLLADTTKTLSLPQWVLLPGWQYHPAPLNLVGTAASNWAWFEVTEPPIPLTWQDCQHLLQLASDPLYPIMKFKRVSLHSPLGRPSIHQSPMDSGIPIPTETCGRQELEHRIARHLQQPVLTANASLSHNAADFIPFLTVVGHILHKTEPFAVPDRPSLTTFFVKIRIQEAFVQPTSTWPQQPPLTATDDASIAVTKSMTLVCQVPKVDPLYTSINDNRRYVFFAVAYQVWDTKAAVRTPCLVYTAQSNCLLLKGPATSLSLAFPDLHALRMSPQKKLVTWPQPQPSSPLYMGLASRCHKHRIMTYQGEITRVIDTLLGLFELDHKFMLCLMTWPPYHPWYPFRHGTVIKLHNAHMGLPAYPLRFWSACDGESSTPLPLYPPSMVGAPSIMKSGAPEAIMWGCLTTQITPVRFSMYTATTIGRPSASLVQLIQTQVPPTIRCYLGIMDQLMLVDCIWQLERGIGANQARGTDRERFITVLEWVLQYLAPNTNSAPYTPATFNHHLQHPATDLVTDYLLHGLQEAPGQGPLLTCGSPALLCHYVPPLVLPSQIMQWVRRHESTLWDKDATAFDGDVFCFNTSIRIVPSTYWHGRPSTLMGTITREESHPHGAGWVLLTDAQGAQLPLVPLWRQSDGGVVFRAPVCQNQLWAFDQFDLVVERLDILQVDKRGTSDHQLADPVPCISAGTCSDSGYVASRCGHHFYRVYARVAMRDSTQLRWSSPMLAPQPSAAYGLPKKWEHLFTAEARRTLHPTHHHHVEQQSLRWLLFIPTYVYYPQWRVGVAPHPGAFQGWVDGYAFSLILDSNLPAELASQTRPSQIYPFACVGAKLRSPTYARAYIAYPNAVDANVAAIAEGVPYLLEACLVEDVSSQQPPQFPMLTTAETHLANASRIVATQVIPVMLVTNKPLSTVLTSATEAIDGQSDVASKIPQQPLPLCLAKPRHGSLGWQVCDVTEYLPLADPWVAPLHLYFSGDSVDLFTKCWWSQVMPTKCCAQPLHRLIALDSHPSHMRASQPPELDSHSEDLHSFRGKIISREVAPFFSWPKPPTHDMNVVSTPSGLAIFSEQHAKLGVGAGRQHLALVLTVQDLSTADTTRLYLNLTDHLYPLGLLPGTVIEVHRVSRKLTKQGHAYFLLEPCSTLRVVATDTGTRSTSHNSLDLALPLLQYRPTDGSWHAWCMPAVCNPSTALCATENPEPCTASGFGNGTIPTSSTLLQQLLASSCPRPLTPFRIRGWVSTAHCAYFRPLAPPDQQHVQSRRAYVALKTSLASQFIFTQVQMVVFDGTTRAVLAIRDFDVAMDLLRWPANRSNVIKQWVEQGRELCYKHPHYLNTPNRSAFFDQLRGIEVTAADHFFTQWMVEYNSRAGTTAEDPSDNPLRDVRLRNFTLRPTRMPAVPNAKEGTYFYQPHPAAGQQCQWLGAKDTCYECVAVDPCNVQDECHRIICDLKRYGYGNTSH
ncbi:hypothetical protein H4R35_004523, partial [Dimargaris xerosporica]